MNLKLYYVEWVIYGKEEIVNGTPQMKMELYDMIVEAEDLITACNLAIGTSERTELRSAKYIGTVAVRQDKK